MTEITSSAFQLDDLDMVKTYEPKLSDGGDGLPPIDGEGDDGDGDRPDRITVTYSGKALEQILDEAERLGIDAGEFLRKSMKLGVISARASRSEIIDFRFETFFHEDDLYRTD